MFEGDRRALRSSSARACATLGLDATGIGVMPGGGKSAVSRRSGRARRRARPPQMADRLHRGARRRRSSPARSTSRSASSPAAARPPTRIDRCVEVHKQAAHYAATAGVDALGRAAQPLRVLLPQHRRAGRRPGRSASDEPNYGYLYDTFHFNIEENSITDVIPATIARRSTTSTSPRTIAACPAPATSTSRRCSRRCKAAGYDGWMTIEAFGSALPDLAAATKIWRPLFEQPRAGLSGRLSPDARRLGPGSVGPSTTPPDASGRWPR